mmetsp:Transcript_161955/g.519310  ORF Transcript_161955/g.519310 Transcript_161955/m.519310 type:complete len:82 (-) Transcript_161955:4-249(-)
MVILYVVAVALSGHSSLVFNVATTLNYRTEWRACCWDASLPRHPNSCAHALASDATASASGIDACVLVVSVRRCCAFGDDI